MKRIRLITIGITLLLNSACNKVSYSHLNQLVKDLFCFKAGSEWTYYDSITNSTKVLHILEYTEHYEGYPSPYKRYAGEIIVLNGFFFSDFKITISTEDAGKEYDKTAIFEGINITANGEKSVFLSFICDKKNNFNCSVMYHTEYSMSGTTYKDVYIFNQENIQYYFAKNIGLIRMVEVDNFDLVLIDKSIFQ